MSLGFSTAAEFAAQLCREGFSWHLSGEGFVVVRSAMPNAVEELSATLSPHLTFFLWPNDTQSVIFDDSVSFFFVRAACGAAVMTSKGDGSGVALKVGDVLLVDPGYMVCLSVGDGGPMGEVDCWSGMPV